VTALPAALATVALAALIAVAGYTLVPLLLAAAVAMAVLLLARGWARVLDLPAPRGTAAVVVVTGWAAAALAVRAAGMTRPLAPFAALLALGVLLAFGHELVRRERHDLVESVTGTLSGQALALLGGGWVLLPTTPLSLTALTAAVVAAVAAVATGRITGGLDTPVSSLPALPLPDDGELSALLDAVHAGLSHPKAPAPVAPEVRHRALVAARGLTEAQARRAFTRALRRDPALGHEGTGVIAAEKKRLLGRPRRPPSRRPRRPSRSSSSRGRCRRGPGSRRPRTRPSPRARAARRARP